MIIITGGGDKTFPLVWGRTLKNCAALWTRERSKKERNAKLGFPEIKLALFPGGGGSERLPRLIGYSKALELMLTGEVIGAQEARQIGLVNRVAEENSALEESIKLAESIARYSLAAIQRIKKVVKRGLCLNFAKANQQAILDSKEAFSTHDANEGVNAFLEKRAAKFTNK
ncbi:MAG: hypothetical protein GXO75_15215 [Calditrichaeota bacterium]|nr:hypothetical protein [Calditrichota bacterium]